MVGLPIGRVNNHVAFHAGTVGVSLASSIFIFVLMCPPSTFGWKLGVRDQGSACYLYSHETKTCFVQSHVNGRVALQLRLTPTSPADLTTPPHVSWFRRVKLRGRPSLAVVNLLDRGRPPDFMELSANRTALTIKILSEYDMSRNSFKARVGSKGHGDYQNFVIESEPIYVEAPETAEHVTINTMDYFTIPGREAHFDWSQEGARHLPRNAGISHDGKRLAIRHYLPAEDSGVYVCEVYSPADYFIAGRHFILGSASQTHSTIDRSTWDETVIDAASDQEDDSALLEWGIPQASFGWLQNEPDFQAASAGISDTVHTFKDNGDIYYVQRSKTQHLACLPSNMAAIDLTAKKVRYAWGRPEDNDAVTTFDTSRYLTIDGGILEISDVGPKDSGSLECNVTHRDVTGQPRVATFTYGIEVYTLPDFVYSVSAAFISEECASPRRSAVFRQLLGSHLQASLVAHDTSYEITHFVASCSDLLRVPTVGAGVGSGRGGWLNLVRFDVVVRHTMVTQCSMQCMVGEMETKTMLIGMKLGAFFSRELDKEQYGYHPSRLIPDSLRFDLKYRCEESYGLQASICVACAPGSFSQRDSTECTQCAVGTYQSSYGATDCVPCPTHEYTFWPGAVSSNQCQVKAVIKWSMLGASGIMTLSGLIVSGMLYGYRKRHQQTAAGYAPVTHPKSNTASEKSPRKTAKARLSRSDVSSTARDGELDGLLEPNDDDDTTYVQEGSVQSPAAPVSYEEWNLYHDASQEPRLESPVLGRSPYGDLYHVAHTGDVNVADKSNTTNSYLPDNDVLDRYDHHHQRLREPLGQLSRSQMVDALGPNERFSSQRPSLQYSFRDDIRRESVTWHPDSPSSVFSGMVSNEPTPDLTVPSLQASITGPQVAQFTPSHSSQTGRLMSPHHPRGSSPSYQQVPFQEDNLTRYPSTSFHDPLGQGFSPPHPPGQTFATSPSLISTASSTSLSTGRAPSLRRVGLCTPLSSRPSSRSDRLTSLVVPVDLSDETDSEIEIGSFTVEDSTMQPSDETRRSSLISKPPIPPRGSSVAALIASYQSLSRSGPSRTAPQANRLTDQSSLESTTTPSTKTSAIAMEEHFDANAMMPNENPPLFPRTLSRENSVPITFNSDGTPSDFLSRQSPPLSPQRDPSITLTPSISPAVVVTAVVSPTGAKGPVTAALSRGDLDIPPFSPPRTPHEVRSKTVTPTRSRGFMSSAISDHSGHTPPAPAPPSRPSSVQSSRASPEASLLTRSSLLMTSPAGRPANPFQQQRLRRQSLEGRQSSHVTAALPPTPRPQTASAHTGVPPPAPNGTTNAAAPPQFPPVPVVATVASSLPMATTTAAPPPVSPATPLRPTDSPLLDAAPPSISTLPDALSLPPPPPPIGPPPSAHSISAHPSLAAGPSVSVSAPVNVPPPPPPHPTPSSGPPPLATPPSLAAPTLTPERPSAAPHPVAALVNRAVTGRGGLGFLTSGTVDSGVSIAPSAATPGSVPGLPGGSTRTPAPPPPPPPPPLHEED